jgi:hypothetical protein
LNILPLAFFNLHVDFRFAKSTVGICSLRSQVPTPAACEQWSRARKESNVSFGPFVRAVGWQRALASRLRVEPRAVAASPRVGAPFGRPTSPFSNSWSRSGIKRSFVSSACPALLKQPPFSNPRHPPQNNNNNNNNQVFTKRTLSVSLSRFIHHHHT